MTNALTDSFTPSSSGSSSSGFVVTRSVGLFGGTFDPPHVGHLVTGVWTRSALDLDEVWFVVAHRPWQKVGGREITPAEDRLALVTASIEGVAGLEVSDVEIRRGGDSFLIDTLVELGEGHPETEFWVILGADAAAGLRTWKRWEELRGLARFVVVDRIGTAANELPSEFDFTRVSIPRLDISSTELRERLNAGLPIDGLVPASVSSLIARRGLYRGSGI